MAQVEYEWKPCHFGKSLEQRTRFFCFGKRLESIIIFYRVNPKTQILKLLEDRFLFLYIRLNLHDFLLFRQFKEEIQVQSAKAQQEARKGEELKKELS